MTGRLSSWATPVRVGVELVELRREDGYPLDALWYPADEARVGMLHVHGKGSSVLTGPSRFLPPLLPGIAHLAVNMRCHDLAYTVGTDDWAVDGGMWEDLTTGYMDLAAGVGHLVDRGVERIVVSGHSSGGFYAADLMPREPRIAAWVQLSPLTTNKNPFPLWWPDPADQARAADLAHAMVGEGRGHELIPVSGWFHAISAASLVQRLEEPDGIWVSNVRHATAPVLLAWGDAERRHPLWDTLFAEFANDRNKRLILRGAGHYYRGQERELASGIATFLQDVVGSPEPRGELAVGQRT